jgi:hypothetical protein
MNAEKTRDTFAALRLADTQQKVKTQFRTCKPDIRSPWMTRAEAADYMRCSLKSVDRKSVRMSKERVPGMLRRQVQEAGGIQKVLILAEDVYAICPLPPGFIAHERSSCN